MKISFFGAAREVTGSCHLLTLSNGKTVLLDCGLFQGDLEDLDTLNESFSFDPSTIDVMVLSHAHIDHCGRVPKLVKEGFRGKIYCTHATRSLAHIMLMDTAHIQERDAEYENDKTSRRPHIKNHYKNKHKEIKPLYDSEDVKRAMEYFVGVSYEQWVNVIPEVACYFTDAGHILGSASVNLKIQDGNNTINFGFTGDIGRPERPILRDPQAMLPADIIITESTYGDKLHEEKPSEKNRLIDIINTTCVKNRGKLIIPAFSLGRTQEIVYILDQLENENKLPKVQVYVDSPLAINATEIYKHHPECFDHDLHQYILKDPDPFGFSRLHYLKLVEDSKRLNSSKEPCIIISASGMANAGRVKHHIFNNIENPKNTILVVGYCTPSTPGGIIRSGAKSIRLFGEEKLIKARVEIMDSFSAHGDRDEMQNFLKNQSKTCKKLFLVHGDYDVQKMFKTYLSQDFKDIEIPELKSHFTV